MPDLLRRVAVRTVAFAIAMALVVPLSARSATPIAPETRRLLAAASEPLPLLDRGPAGREASAALSLQEIGPSIGVETLQVPVVPTPGVVAPTVSFGTVIMHPHADGTHEPEIVVCARLRLPAGILHDLKQMIESATKPPIPKAGMN